MHDASPSAAVDATADATVPGRSLTFERRWTRSTSEQLERTRLIEQAGVTDAAAQLQRCCPNAARVLESLSWRALTRLAANEPVDLNDSDSWRSPDAHAQIVLRRHGITGIDSTRLTMEAVRALIDGQARADREAGLDWTRLDVPGRRSTQRSGAPTPGCRSRSRTRRSTPTATTSAVRLPPGLAWQANRRAISHAGCWATPTPSSPAICAAGGSPRPHG
jgi:hypothetical protein